MLDRLTSEVDTVIHLAVGVKRMVENPVHTVETHIKGTEMMLSALCDQFSGYAVGGIQS